MRKICLLCVCLGLLVVAVRGQSLLDSFSDGDFTSMPAWTGDLGSWTVVASSDVAAGATGSNTLRLNHTVSEAGTQHLSTQIANWGSEQEWGFWIGRRGQAFTASNQMMIWLYATEANLESGTVDGYRLLIGDDSGNDEILLQSVTDGVGTTILASAQAITNGLTDIGFLVRVTRSNVGLFTLYTSALPTSSGNGAIATDIPNSTNANIDQGSVTSTTITPSANGYVGIVAVHSSGASPRAAVEFDQVYFTAGSGGATITVNTVSLPSFGTVQVGTTSSVQSYTVDGSNLTEDITVIAPPGFEISTASAGGFGGTIVLTQSGGIVASTTIYVRFVPADALVYAGDITHTSAGATTVNVAVSGTGVAPIPFQVVVHETMGNVSGTTSIAAHATANGFDNDNLTYSGTADIRSTSASMNYAGASGGANVFFSTTATPSFQIGGINTTGLNNLELSFGLFKSTTSSTGSDFVVEVSSDGVIYSTLSFPALPTGTGTATWYYRTASGTIPATENLRIQFRQTGAATQYRIDDVLLRNTATAPVITAGGSTSLCEGESVTLTSSAAASYLWSTSATTQSIVVSGAGSYSVTVTDAKGNSATSSAVDVTVTPTVAAAGAISGSAAVTAGQVGVTYSIADVNGATGYVWTVPSGAAIASGQGTTSITVDWGLTSGNVTVTPGNSCFTGTSSSLAVAVTQVHGTVSGTVSRTGGSGLANVIVKLLDNAMLPLSDVVTNSLGEYSFSGLAPAPYNIMIVEPLGYLADVNPKPATVVDATPVDVDFTLSQIVASNNAQKRPYWKHQFDVHVRGHGRFEETASQLQSYINIVQQHYTPHFDIFASTLSFPDWQDALSRDRNIPPYIDKAMMEIAALVLNLASLKIGQYTVVTEDSRTAGELLTYVSQLFTDPDVTRRDYTKARELAKKVNEGKTIRAGEVPSSSILYKGRAISWGFGMPTEFALYQNSPNPFNPTTTIVYDIPRDGRVVLKVCDIAGREVATLVDGTARGGRYYVDWNATGMASGMYFYRLVSGSFHQTKKMILLR